MRKSKRLVLPDTRQGCTENRFLISEIRKDLKIWKTEIEIFWPF